MYGKVFPALIADWRAQWHVGDFPFLLVQIANFQIQIPTFFFFFFLRFFVLFLLGSSICAR